ALRGCKAPLEHAKPDPLFEGYLIADDRESTREELRKACPLPSASDFEAVASVVERARDDKFSLVCQLVKAGHHGRVYALIDCVNRLDPLAHVERAERAAVGGDTRVCGDRLSVDEQAARDERGVDVAQGVHDALDRDASQRPTTERDVEAL